MVSEVKYRASIQDICGFWQAKRTTAVEPSVRNSANPNEARAIGFTSSRMARAA